MFNNWLWSFWAILHFSSNASLSFCLDTFSVKQYTEDAGSMFNPYTWTLREIYNIIKWALNDKWNWVKAFLQTENLGNRLRACKPWTRQCGNIGERFFLEVSAWQWCSHKIGLKLKRVPNVQNNLDGSYLASVLYNKSVQHEICRLSSSHGFLEFIKLLFPLFQSLVCEVFIHKYICIHVGFRIPRWHGK